MFYSPIHNAVYIISDFTIKMHVNINGYKCRYIIIILNIVPATADSMFTNNWKLYAIKRIAPGKYYYSGH